MAEYELSDDGARMITGFEAQVLHVYHDQVGIETVCVGHVVRPEDEVWLRDGVTREECQTVLQRDTRRFTAAISRLVKVPLSQPMVDALTSLIFNIGEGAFATSTVLRELNQRHYADAADAFLLWRWANVLQRDGSHIRKPILLGRREAEARLFRTGILQVTMGATFSEPPQVPSLLAQAQAAVAKQFTRLDMLDDRGLPPEPSNDELTPDGRLVALPPDRENEAA